MGLSIACQAPWHNEGVEKPVSEDPSGLRGDFLHVSDGDALPTAPFEPRNQPIVIDPVKECFQVEVHHPTVAFADIRLQLPHTA